MARLVAAASAVAVGTALRTLHQPLTPPPTLVLIQVAQAAAWLAREAVACMGVRAAVARGVLRMAAAASAWAVGTALPAPHQPQTPPPTPMPPSWSIGAAVRRERAAVSSVWKIASSEPNEAHADATEPATDAAPAPDPETDPLTPQPEAAARSTRTMYRRLGARRLRAVNGTGGGAWR